MGTKEFMASVTILGSFKEWPSIAAFCDKTIQNDSGLGVGIINRTILTDLGNYRISYVLLYVDKAISHKIRRNNIVSIDQVKQEGLEAILHTIGKKTIINILLKSSKMNSVGV